ncbi:protein kinase domain-containing protein [Actinomycetospora sp.]|uniref:protein kinase domain-containing protein n=1 Tax=Actinomycetospora sp. TaxID=1872135 RepID=UPI002F4231BE
MKAEVGVGATIGRYRLDGHLGRGGMGEVYRAFDTGRERSVALKLLLRELALDDEFVARFRREARVAARLSEPHILPIHDFGEIDGRLYIDMRLVDGPDLAAVLAHGAVAPDRTAAIISQVSSGLDSAHREGLVHRDVKPGNVLLATDDPVFAYLTDFGVAAEQDRSENLTSTGTVIGTVAYLAPEMFEGIRPGPSSDIYALGCVLAEMLLGHRPFRTSSVAEAMHAHLTQAPPRPSRERPGVPAAFDDIVARAMAKDPRQRYTTAGEMGAAVLAAVRSDPGAPASTALITRPATPAPTGSERSPDTAWSAAPGPDTAAGSGPVRTTVTGSPPARPFEVAPPRVGRIPVRPDYRRTSEPLRYPAVIPFLGNQRFVDLVRQRIRYSPGGSLLLTGLDGAGKTTVVARALDELHTELVSTEPEPTPLAVVWESVARPTSPTELIVRILRGLAEALDRNQILPRLPEELVELIDLAHRRTTTTLWGAQAGAAEQTTTTGRKRGRSTGGEQAALPYGVAEAEYDLLRIVAALAAGAGGEDTPSRRWFRKDAAPAWAGRVVVVIDELDQLTRDPAGTASIEELLRVLKNTLTASSAHFVFVAGADVVDLARRSQARGTNIWAAVFGRPLYLNCLPPSAPGELLAGLLTVGGAGVHPELPDYLEYRSRGLPALLLHELDELVEWHPDGPHVVIDQATALLVSFYASLERRLGPLWAQARPRGVLTDPVDVDGRRSATYLVVDWILERRGTTFTASDFMADRAAGVTRRDLTSDEECLGLLRELATVGILDAREPDSARATSVGRSGRTETVYRLARSVAEAVAQVAPASRELGRVAEGRYVLVEELGRGALGRTYRARDAFLGRDVAVRMLDVREQHDEVARERFRREVDLARRLEHPLLAATIAVVDDGARPGLVSDFVVGLSLDDLIARGPLRAPVAVDLALGLVDLLRYLDDQGVVRLDLKPSHVVITADGRPVVVELGPARRDEDDQPRLTGAGIVVGTPLYLSPEQLAGRPVDVRSDLYSLGLILVEMLLGHPARGGSVATIVAQAATHRPDLSGLTGSAELRDVITQLLDPDPENRHDDPAELAAALEALPERRED